MQFTVPIFILYYIFSYITFSVASALKQVPAVITGLFGCMIFFCSSSLFTVTLMVDTQYNSSLIINRYKVFTFRKQMKS